VSLNFANKITIARIIAVPIFIGTVLYYSKQNDFLRFVSLGVFLFAVISDVFDGYIARTRNQKTKAGAILDPLADKFLLISAFVCLFYKGNFWADVIRFPGCDCSNKQRHNTHTWSNDTLCGKWQIRG